MSDLIPSQFKASWLGADHQAQIVELRRREFGRYYQDQVDLTGLEWSKSDRNSLHIGVLHQAELIAALRITLIDSPRLFEANTKIPLPSGFAPMYGLLGRGVTDQKWEHLGLHSFLRWAALKICQQEQVSSVWGSLETRSARLPQMLDLGYEILATLPGWEGSYIQSKGPVALAALKNPGAIESAIEKLDQRLRLKPYFDFQELSLGDRHSPDQIF